MNAAQPGRIVGDDRDKPRALIVDGTNLIARAHYAVRDRDPAEAPGLAITMLERVTRELMATYLFVALDCRAETFRRRLEPSYKANRDGRDVSTADLVDAVRPRLAAAGVATFEHAGYEADDVCATLARRAAIRSQVIVYSNDRDLLALCGPRVRVVRPANAGAFQWWDATRVCEEYGIASPLLVPELKALTGETGDNIVGVPGIGPKKAAKLLARFTELAADRVEGALERAIALVDSCGAKDDLAKLAGRIEQLRIAHTLATLVQNVPIPAIEPRHVEVARLNWTAARRFDAMEAGDVA